MQMKTCTKCHTSKEINEFHRDKSHKDGYRSICKICGNKKSKDFRTNNPELSKQIKMNSRLRDPIKYMLINVKSRCKFENTEFNITKDDLTYTDSCPVLGMQLDYFSTSKGRGFVKENAASIDRIDNSKGYIPGNVRIISWRANKIKSDTRICEMRLIIEDYQRIIDK